MKKNFAAPARALGALACLLVMSGCALNPMPRWQPPDNPSGEYDMGYARRYAARAQEAYQVALDHEVVAERALSNGLIGLGVATAGLAVSNSHRSAITGAALLGGAGLAYGNWNTSRQRQMVYTVARETTTCAVKAVAPYALSAADRDALNVALRNLEEAIGQATSAVNALTNAKATLADNDPAAVAASARIASATTAISAARDVLVNGRKIASNVRMAGAQLVAAVDQISEATDKAILDTLPDLNSVRAVIAGLGAMSASFAPGAGIDTALSNAFKGGAQSAPLTGSETTKSSLAREDAAVVATQQSLLDAVAAVNSQTAGIASDANFAALQGCSLQVAFPLVATPTTISMTAGTASTYSVVLTGGTAPFTVKQQGPAVTGLTISAPMGFDRTIHIVATSELAAATGVSLLVLDASNPPKSVTVAISIGAAQGTGTPPAQNGSTDAGTTLIEKIKKAKPFVVGSNPAVTVTINAAQVSQSGTKIIVPVTCAPTPASPIAQDAVYAVLMSTLGAQAALGTVQFDGPCVAPPAASPLSGSAQSAPLYVRDESLAQVQRGLCVKPDGVWGPRSGAALERWRERTKSPSSPGAPITAQEKQALSESKQAATCKPAA